MPPIAAQMKVIANGLEEIQGKDRDSEGMIFFDVVKSFGLRGTLRHERNIYAQSDRVLPSKVIDIVAVVISTVATKRNGRTMPNNTAMLLTQVQRSQSAEQELCCSFGDANTSACSLKVRVGKTKASKAKLSVASVVQKG